MTNTVLDAFEANAAEFAALGPENEKLGRLTDRAAGLPPRNATP